MRFFITGITGFLGRALTRRLLEEGHAVAGLSRDEHRARLLRRRFPGVTVYLGDITHPQDLARAFQDFRPSAILHLAALKVIPESMAQPWPYIRTNVLGTMFVLETRPADAAVLFVSSDKAAAPFNHYGATKRVCEQPVLASGGTVVRLGNVFGSTGSVFWLWRSALRQGEELPITDPTMTRFLISRDEAVDFILRWLGQPGLYVPKLSSYRLADFQAAFREVAAARDQHPRFVPIPPRPGEKFHEVLFSEEEAPLARDLGDAFHVGPGGPLRRAYSSAHRVRDLRAPLRHLMEAYWDADPAAV